MKWDEPKEIIDKTQEVTDKNYIPLSLESEITISVEIGKNRFKASLDISTTTDPTIRVTGGNVTDGQIAVHGGVYTEWYTEQAGTGWHK